MVAGDIEDFSEYKEDVDILLKEGNLAPTAGNVRGAYTMAVGNREVEARAAKRREGSGTIPPSAPPSGDPPKEGHGLSALEVEIAAAHQMTPEQWAEEKKDAPLAIKLPTG